MLDYNFQITDDTGFKDWSGIDINFLKQLTGF